MCHQVSILAMDAAEDFAKVLNFWDSGQFSFVFF
jgi:hypothetical protein